MLSRTIVSNILGLCLSAVSIVAPMRALAQGQNAGRTFTSDADFDLGTLTRVQHDSPSHNQLQMVAPPEMFPYVNVACSARGTVTRIFIGSADGSQPPVVVGEYKTAPDGMGKDPSRTTVDHQGNVWVANRAESSGGKGSITRIALVMGGTRANADGTADPNGQYLKPPFEYTSIPWQDLDRDDDGLIKTSRGLGNILAWTNAGGADTNGGVSTAEDELLLNYVRVDGTAVRTLAVDENNDLWAGGRDNRKHEKVSGQTGQVVPGTLIEPLCGGYDEFVDRQAVI